MTSLTRNLNRSAGTRRHPLVATRLIAFGICFVGLLAFAAAPALAATKHVSTSKTTVVTVTLGQPTELGFKLSSRNVPAGKIQFNVTNKGSAHHDFEICTAAHTGTTYPNTCTGKTTEILAPGKSDTITVTLSKGVYEYLCTVPGHAQAGMKGSFGVGQAKAPATPSSPKVAAPSTTLVASDACPAPVATTVNVDEFEYGYNLTDSSGNPVTSVPCGSVMFDMTNTGAIVHNFDISYLAGGTLAGIGPFLEPNSSSTMTVTLTPGTWAYQCDVPEHAVLGMVGSLEVTSS